MCGIFSTVHSEGEINQFKKLELISKLSESRGKEASGLLLMSQNKQIQTLYSENTISKLIKTNKRVLKKRLKSFEFYIGHTRIVTHGVENESDNKQPVSFNDTFLVHNGICVNYKEIWKKLNLDNEVELDSRSIAALIDLNINKNIFKILSEQVSGETSIIGYNKKINKLFAYTNTGSLYFVFDRNKVKFLASEKYTLLKLSDSENIKKIEPNSGIIFNPEGELENTFVSKKNNNITHQFSFPKKLKAIKELEFVPKITRCFKCILPETVPFIEFNKNGICNFCNNYKKIMLQKIQIFEDKLDSMRRSDHEHDSIVSFSGGRDSAYGLHVLKTKYNMNPLAVSYDWGVLSDLGRVNQSIMTSKLGVEHIWFSADIKEKRHNVYKNLNAWLKKPEFGMIPILMAGDKMWLEVANLVGKQNNIRNIFFFENKLETTYFKQGFAGLKPRFNSKNVNGLELIDAVKLINYYFYNFIKNPYYLNTSLIDSIKGLKSYLFRKNNYIYPYDFIPWDEEKINKILIEDYGWSADKESSTTWRLGDGTTPFYNYLYFLKQGFTENDFLRSWQINEGVINRDEALLKALNDNQPNLIRIREYLNTIGFNYEKTIDVIDDITSNVDWE